MKKTFIGRPQDGFIRLIYGEPISANSNAVQLPVYVSSSALRDQYWSYLWFWTEGLGKEFIIKKATLRLYLYEVIVDLLGLLQFYSGKNVLGESLDLSDAYKCTTFEGSLQTTTIGWKEKSISPSSIARIGYTNFRLIASYAQEGGQSELYRFYSVEGTYPPELIIEGYLKEEINKVIKSRFA